MIYKGMKVDPSQINKPYTLNDVPDNKWLSEYSDVIPRNDNESTLSYRQRIVNYLNEYRNKIVSGIASLTHNSDKLELRATNYNSRPGQNIFQSYKSDTLQSKLFTTLDIETDDKGRPITISALKQIFNEETKQFETVDSYQRFYHAKNTDLKQSAAVHGLNSAKLRRLRSQQSRLNGNVGYSKVYNADEASGLRKFLEDSIIVGHNIVDFDLPHLFNAPLGNQVIDTLTASRNQWKGKKNDLDSVFYRMFGKTMSQAGLSHHDSTSDILANAMIMQKMLTMKGKTGDALRYVVKHPGTHIAPEDEYIGSQVIDGFYNEYRRPERYVKMNERELGGEYNEDTGKYELPDGMHYEDISSSAENMIRGEDAELMTRSLADIANYLHRDIALARQTSQEARDAYQLGNMSRVQQTVRNLSAFDNEDTMRADLTYTYGITNKDVQDIWIKRALHHRELRQKQNMRNNMTRRRAAWQAHAEGRDVDAARLNLVDTPEELWSVLGGIQERENKLRFAKYKTGKISALQQQYNLNTEEYEGSGSWKNRLSHMKSKDTFDDLVRNLKFEKAKDARINDLAKTKLLTRDAKNLLKMENNLEDFNMAADKAADKINAITKAVSALGSIQPYNFERLEKAVKGQVSGVMGSLNGLIPTPLYSPLSRLSGASMNALTERFAFTKAGVRAGTAIGSGLVGAGTALAATGAGAIPGLIVGGIGAITGITSQIIGNAHEGAIIERGEGIQNNLNTLGFIKDMILAPFRLLRTAIMGVLRGLNMFRGALTGLSGLMKSGLSTLTGMGNPITGMTGVGYGDYVGLNSADAASLLNKGTINNIMNDFAQQRMKLYTVGQLDTNRLVASSMLGIFDETYGYKAGDEEAFTKAINKVHNDTKNMDPMKKKQQFVLANMVNSNMAEILQTMDTLGIDDFNELKRPRGMWGYSNGALDGYRRRFQRSQWEYQYGNSQWDITKGRIATSLWNGPAGFNISGKGLVNNFNIVMKSIADALDTGNWRSVGDTIKGVWDMIKEGASGLWSAIQDAFNMDKSMKFGDYLKGIVIGWGSSIVDLLRNKLVPAIFDIWDQITDIFIDRFTSLASYLSTIKIDFKEFVNQVVKGNVSDKPWITSLGDHVYNAQEQESRNLLNTLSPVTISYDKRFGINNLWQTKYGGKTMPGVPNINYDHDYDAATSRLKIWMNNVLSTGTPEQIEYLNGLLETQLGFNPGVQKGQNGDEFLDYLVQHQIKASGANLLHGNKWGDIQGDIVNDPFNKGMHSIVENYRNLRGPILDGFTDTVLNTAGALTGIQIQDPAVLKVQFRDDKGNAFAGASVKMSGKVDTKVYNGFVDLESKDGVFNFQVSQQTRGTR